MNEKTTNGDDELMKRAKEIVALDPTPEWLKKFANLGATEDTLPPKVFKDFHEYPISKVAKADIAEPALYALLDPTYRVIHVGISKNLRERMKMHMHNASTSNLKWKVRSAKIQDINAYKIRFLRWKNATLENIEKFILICFRQGKQS